MDPESRAALRASAGFCPPHAELWAGSASVLATAHLYGDLMKRLSDELATLRPPGGAPLVRRRSNGRRLRLFESASPCRFCVEDAQTSAHFAEVLGRTAADEAMRSALSNGSLCVPHGKLALGQASAEESFLSIRDHLIKQTDEVSADLREIVRKHDYRFQGEPVGSEVGAGKRAMRLVVGDGTTSRGW
jgi:hypothetical protein